MKCEAWVYGVSLLDGFEKCHAPCRGAELGPRCHTQQRRCTRTERPGLPVLTGQWHSAASVSCAWSGRLRSYAASPRTARTTTESTAWARPFRPPLSTVAARARWATPTAPHRRQPCGLRTATPGVRCPPPSRLPGGRLLRWTPIAMQRPNRACASARPENQTRRSRHRDRTRAADGGDRPGGHRYRAPLRRAAEGS